MTKKSLTLLIVESALRTAANHVLRLNTINQLADKGCLPMHFINTNNKSFWMFTVAGFDFHYEETEANKFFVKIAENNYKDLPKQNLELS